MIYAVTFLHGSDQMWRKCHGFIDSTKLSEKHLAKLIEAEEDRLDEHRGAKLIEVQKEDIDPEEGDSVYERAIIDNPLFPIQVDGAFIIIRED